jgi:NADH-quinone oxidoreductase subunit G
MEITTYVEQSVDHELSANIVDLCPVGALNNKPFRFRGRSWEMTQHALVSPHDAVGSNLYAHALRGKLMRIVPRQNDAINETWIADRDRFGFEGIYSDDRVQQPLLRVDGELRAVDWETALAAAADGLSRARDLHGPKSLGFLAAPSSTVEEFFLAAQIARALGTDNIDHRLRQTDFSAQDGEAVFPCIGLALADIDRLQGILIIGSHLRDEVPLLAHRIRKAAIKGGAKVAFLNPQPFDYLFPAVQHTLGDKDLLTELRAVIHACADIGGQSVPAAVAGAAVDGDHRALAKALLTGERRAVFLGHLAQRHPAYAQVQALAQTLAQLSGATFGLITEGANSAGAYLTGAVPHRRIGGERIAQAGLNAQAMLDTVLQAYVLLGDLDAPEDFAAGSAALKKSGFIVALTPHLSEGLRDVAHVVLPIGTFAETAGTFVNCEGRWQSWAGAVKPVGESRPGWKVLRVLGNLLGLSGFEYASAEEVRDAAKTLSDVEAKALTGAQAIEARTDARNGAAAGSWIQVPIYRSDALVRRSASLAKTSGGQAAIGVL